MSKFHPLTSRHPFTTAWRNIWARCTDPRDIAYYCYGQRGIKVCAQWLDFRQFFTDMHPTWGPKLQIDRIDNNGDYCKENCRWVSAAINVRNSSLATLTQAQVDEIRLRLGSKPNQTRLAAEYGVTPQTICDIKKGRSWQ